MMEDEVLVVTIVNHVAVDIAAPRDTVWKVILDEYVEAKKFREGGYSIEPLDDLAAAFGGYRMRLWKDGLMVDERVCHITERDENAHRLSLFADYLSVPTGMQVFATYHAQEAPGGTRYALDCHARMGIPAPAGGTKKDVAAMLTQMEKQFDAALLDYLGGVKKKIEG